MGTSEGDDWVAAAELGEYAFCPRAHWYSQTRGSEVPEGPSSRAGRRFHARELSGVRRASERRGAYVAALLIALVVAAVAGALLLGVL